MLLFDLLVNMSGKENIYVVEQPSDLSTEIAHLKQRRATAKAAVTRAIAAVDKLIAVDSNVMIVKEHMVDFNRLLQEFANTHRAYVEYLTNDNERSEANEYWQRAITPVNEFSDVVGAWIAELDDHGNFNEQIEHCNIEQISNDDRVEHNIEPNDQNVGHDECTNEHDEQGDDKIEEINGHDIGNHIEDESKIEQSRIEQTLQHNAALHAKVQVVKRQQALELEAFELQNLELEERMNLERQRLRLQIELEKRRRHVELEMKQMKDELAQLKMNAETKEDTPTDAAAKAAKVDQRFTHSTPNVSKPNVSTPKQDLQPPPPKTSDLSFGSTRQTLQSKPSDAESQQPPWTPSTLYRGDSIPQYTPSTSLVDVLQRMMNDTRLHQQSLVDSLHRPKIELMTFDGDPLKYWPFVRTFANAVDSKSDDDGSKLNSLMQYCTGKARSLLECCLVKEPTEGYELAWKLLKERFGNNDVISQAWIAKILDRPKIKDTQGLQTFADELRTCRETLLTMGYLNELETRRSLCQIVEKLPAYLHSRWLKVNHAIKFQENRPPTLADVIRLVTDAAQQVSDPVFGKALVPKETSARNDSRKLQDSKQKTKGSHVAQVVSSSNPASVVRPPKLATSATSYDIPKEPCVKCGGLHYITQCKDFKALRVKDRLSFIQSKRLCVNCFKPGHLGRDCTRPFVCTVDGCGQKHSKFLHLPSKPTKDFEATNQRVAAVPQSSAQCSASVSSNFVAESKEKVALPIVAVRVKGKGLDNYTDTYALIDPGGTSGYCSEELAQHLGVPRRNFTCNLSTIHESNTPVTADFVNLQVSNINGGPQFDMTGVMVRPSLNIGLDHLATSADLKKWPHLEGIQLPELNVNEVHLLIGQDTPDLMFPEDTRRGMLGEPYACLTALGWAMNGPISGDRPNTSITSSFTDTKPELNIERQLEAIWKLEGDNCGDSLGLSSSDRKALSVWNESVRLVDQHYTMDIPFKERPPYLPDNRLMAERRLLLLGRRLQKDTDLFRRYTANVHELLEKGYAELVTNNLVGREGYTWYLPHHPVLHPRKPDKCRLVYDCSAKHRGVSLNDKVHQGPFLTNSLVGVLLRFRQEPFAFMADIQGMFNQVHVSKDDRDALRFLWWKDDDPTNTPLTYRMTTHLFGGVWSPSCANFALKKCAQDNVNDFHPSTITTVDRNFYVDDCLKSVASLEEAVNLAKELRELLLRGGFNLTKWVSNSRDVLRAVPEVEWSKEVKTLDLDQELLPAERTLGVLWQVEPDLYGFDVHLEERPLTRRGLLSTVSSVYDPFGFVSPFVLKAKMLFQELCRIKSSWDAPMPIELKGQWNRWLQDLPLIQNLSVPRSLKPKSFEMVSAELHHFADASERAYGAVSYLRMVDDDCNTHCSFLMARSRLAPLKSTTIPRLELAAAVEAVKLDKLLKMELELPLQESVYWSDSMIVLWYLQQQDKRYQTYVANRVAAIQEHTTASQWRYVDSGSNPADDASRGMTAAEVSSTSRWIRGPPFLWKEESEWPTQPEFKHSMLEEEVEFKPNRKVYAVASDKADPIDLLLQRHSSWYGLKKSVAWLLRFKQYMKTKKPPTGRMTVNELRVAATAIVVHVQSKAFGGYKGNSLRKLCPFQSKDGTQRVGGRLNHADLHFQMKHPIILPSNHHVTDLIIRHYHAMTGHTGSERVLAETRQMFWIVKGRAMVRRVLSKCITCKKLRAQPVSQFMGDLPKDRVTPNEAPFTRVGVDYFGPFLVKRARSELKRYGCIFTCLATRAIHIEVSHTLETDSFINALQRFIARRGQPVEIRSDNGTNFTGAQLELRRALEQWNQAHIDDFLQRREIQWIFNPPGASHMGGVWERQIRTVRSVLRGLLPLQVLDEEALTTLMCIVEGIVNGRPITRISDDPKDLAPLTPNHLLLLRSGPTHPPGVFVKQDLYRRRWRQVQYMADVFWKRWVSEYLPTLQVRQKWLCPKRNLKVGDLVLVKHDTTARLRWPLGLIVNTYPGSDGLVRSVQVKTQSGLYDRPVDKICLLEGDIQQADV